MEDRALKSVINSALWAAYGDALGFITEFRDDEGLRKRINAPKVTITVPWQRIIGGRFGVLVDLPAGTYSDDTQLRLATSRAIQGDGHFDVEAFAKIELPVWRCYSLGAGRGTKAAAAALARQDVNWFSNFFAYGDAAYMKGGGNGAAMRVQPHIWSARDRSNPKSFLRSVIRDAVCTHGHPRGILGAVFHAVCLAAAFDRRSIPGYEMWAQAVECFRDAEAAIYSDGDLSTFWLPVWEKHFGGRIEEAFDLVRKECMGDIQIATRYVSGPPEGYKEMVEAIGGLGGETRGSGTKTAIIAAALSFMYRNSDPAEALQAAANLLSTDTDTIATMCGAIMGVVADGAPRFEIMDRSYIELEASRAHEISRGEKTESFKYPDVGGWKAPRTQLDAVGRGDADRLLVSGLGFAKPFEREYRASNQGDGVWQWLRLDFGQSILAKRRTTLVRLPEGDKPNALPDRTPRRARLEWGADQTTLGPGQSRLFTPSISATRESSVNKSLDRLSDEAIRSGFDPLIIGKHVLELAGQPNGIELAVGYASIIAKAKMARSRIEKKADSK
jgi:ADP-ribosylglycohydrolase